MSIGKILYHTVQDRDDIYYVMNNAPFECCRNNAWLGKGYYFWEFIDHAHWWGKQSYKGKYHICKSEYIADQSTILDLHGNVEQIEDFLEGFEMLKNKCKYELTLPEVIEFMKKKLWDEFNYKAVRISSQKDEINKNEIGYNYIPASYKRKDFILLKPRIQICVFDRNSIKLPVKVIKINNACNTNKRS